MRLGLSDLGQLNFRQRELSGQTSHNKHLLAAPRNSKEPGLNRGSLEEEVEEGAGG